MELSIFYLPTWIIPYSFSFYFLILFKRIINYDSLSIPVMTRTLDLLVDNSLLILRANAFRQVFM